MGATTDMIFKLYGHDESASKALKGVGKEAETVGGKLKHIGKMGAVGFAAVGAAALAFAEEGVRAAIKVEKQQKQLDIAIKNNTKSTKEQAKGANEYLEKLRLTYGVSNEKLIPAYAKLVRSTKDLGESQKLMNLAMNISAGTGKDLGAVSVALSKAYNGNFAGLTRLGVPIDKTIIKHKDFKGAVDALSKTFNGSAKASTETFAGKMAILQQNLDSAKEKIGVALLPILTKMADYIVKNVVPNIQAFVDGLTGKSNSVDGAAGKATKGIHDFGEKILKVFKLFKDNIGFIKFAAEYMGLFWGAMKLASGASSFISAMGKVIGVYRTLKSVSIGAAMAEAFASEGTSIPGGILAAAAVAAGFGVAALNINWSGSGKPTKTQIAQGKAAAAAGAQQQRERGHQLGGAGSYSGGGVPSVAAETYWYYRTPYTWDSTKKTWRNPAGVAVSAPPGAPTRHASGGSVAAGTQIMVGENGPELFTPTSGGSITPHNLVGGSGMSVHIHVAGSVIHEKDLAVTVRDNIAQLMRRRGLNPAILGV